jgi:hypothetical protein
MPENEPEIIVESDEQLQEFVKNKRFIHYVGMLIPPRPGLTECMTLVEHKHFPPGTDRNELFILRFIKWSDMVWVMMSIPIEDKNLVEDIAKECGLRIANGVPTMFTGNVIQQFPVNNERIFTFENSSGHPVYRNDPIVNEAIFRAEQETVDKVSKH